MGVSIGINRGGGGGGAHLTSKLLQLSLLTATYLMAARQMRCLSRNGSGNTRQMRCLSRVDSENTWQRRCLVASFWTATYPFLDCLKSVGSGRAGDSVLERPGQSITNARKATFAQLHLRRRRGAEKKTRERRPRDEGRRGEEEERREARMHRVYSATATPFTCPEC